MAYGLDEIRPGGYQPGMSGLARMAGGEQWDRRVPPPLPMIPSPESLLFNLRSVPPFPLSGPRGEPPVKTPPSEWGKRMGQLPWMQLAGDVVPMRPGGLTPMAAERLNAVRTGPGSWGQYGINQLGGQHGPTLDLMDILMYPYGGPMERSRPRSQMMPRDLMAPPRGEEFA